MFFYIVERFSIYLKQFAAQPVGQLQRRRIGKEIEGQAGSIAEALAETVHQVDQIGTLNAQRPHIGNHAPKLRRFISDRLLQRAQIAAHLLGSLRELAAEHVELNIHAQERLQDAVVDVSRNAAALAFDGARAQAPQQEQVL